MPRRESLQVRAVTVPPIVGAGRDTRARAHARQALINVLWDSDGARRLPSERSLSRAMRACDPRDVWWVCEASSAGPVYLLPTIEWIEALATCLDDQGAKSVLEVAAGDGFLSAMLKRVRPQLRVVATDSHAWRKASARMNANDRQLYAGVPFAGIQTPFPVERSAAVAAVKRYAPDVVLVSWAPPGGLVERLIKANSQLVLEIGTDDDACGDAAKTWRYYKEFLDGPVESRALCRLDTGSARGRKTRVTLYFGAAHADHGIDPFAVAV